MSYSPEQAREHIYKTWQATWSDPDKGWRAIRDQYGEPLAVEPKVEFDNDVDDNPPTVDRPLLYLYVRHFASPAATIGGETRKLVDRQGFVLLRVWVPRDSGLKTADRLSYVAKTAFERKRGVGAGNGIVFKSWRPTEAGPQKDGRFMTVSTVDFEYTEITGV